MKLVKIVFSPTGGTQKVADVVAAEIGGSISEIDLTDPKTDFSGIALEKEDIAVIAVPSYGGRIPALATGRISKIHGSQARCIIIGVYGNRAYEDTLIELKDIAEQSDFKVVAAIAAVAEHSIVRQYAAGRPDSGDEEELRGFSRKIVEKLNSGAAYDVIRHIPGNRPYKKAGGGGLVPKAGKECTNCRLCAGKCPAQAISCENAKVTDKDKCISCMRCVAICPQSARSVNQAMVSAVALALKKACSERKNNELYLN